MAGDGGAVLDRFDARCGNIADDITRREVGAEHAQPRNIDLELRKPHRGGDVERSQRLFAKHPVDGQTVARLEATHRLLDIRIVNVVAGGVRVDVARGGETRPQNGDAGVPIAAVQDVDGGDLGPTAATDDVAIPL